jgi:RecB family exonuclease
LVASRHLSVSQLRLLLGCSKRWYFKYVLGLPEPPGLPLREGIAFHRMVELDLKSGKTTHPDDLAFQAAQEVNARPEAYVGPPVDPDVLRTWATLLKSSRHYQEVDPELVEYEFDIPFAPGWTLKGRMDAVAGGIIWDFKTASSPWDVYKVRQDLQATAYLWAARKLGLNVSAVRFLVLVKRGLYFQPPLEAVRTAGDFKVFEETLTQAVRQIELGIYWPNPEYAYCGRKLCPYFAECFYGAH